MEHRELAEKLIAAGTAAARRRLLSRHREMAGLRLAHALKDTYYRSWTNEPEKIGRAAAALRQLERMHPDEEEITALREWVEGISSLTRGRTEEAIGRLDAASRRLEAVGRKHLAAQPQVGKLYALAMLGDYPEAVRTGRRALAVFEEAGDDLSAGKVEKNLGNIIVRQDGISRAERYYLSAIERFRRIGDLEELAMCETNLADNYADLHDFQSAERHYAAALEHTRRAGMTFVEAEIEASLGNLAMLRGRYERALRHLETARRMFEELSVPHRSVIAEFEMANVYFELNLTDEAFEIYRRVVDGLKKFKFRGEEAKARANFGRVALVRGDLREARRQLRRAERLHQLEQNPTGVAGARLARAELEHSLGRYRRALDILRETGKLLARSENVPLKLEARFRHGETLRRLGRNREAAKLLRGVRREAERHERPTLAWSALNSLGRLALDEGDRRTARRHFEKSAELIEHLRAPLPAEEFRMAFLADKLDPYRNLAGICLASDDLPEAFAYVEKARSRALADVLRSAGREGVRRDGRNAALFERLGNLREELNWFYSLQKRAAEQDIAALQEEAAGREKEIARLMRRIESAGPADGRRHTGPAGADVSADELQKRLGADKALIEYVDLDGSISAFVVTGEKIEYFADLAPADEILELLEGLRFQFGTLRYGAVRLESFAGELKKRADHYLTRLHEKLLAPFRDRLAGRELVFVPVSVLHYVPFPGLCAGGRYLVEDHRIVSAPGAAVWQMLAERPARPPGRALLTGFADEHIPLVEEEIREIGSVLPDARVLLGEEAGFANFTAQAGDFDLLHLACHGQFRPDNPLFSSLHLADGFVTVRDIRRLPLKADLVTLSACETGLSKIHPGDEILGLARGFLAAGARSIVLSLWTVSDRSTRDLMRHFYKELQRGSGPAASLQKAQKTLIRDGLHPYFWASFGIIGG